MICTFCIKKGIPSPHNHTVRHWTLPNKPIICPNLLNNECPICKTKGHTRQYCPTRIGCAKSIDLYNHEHPEIIIDKNNINSIKRKLEIEQTYNCFDNNKIQKI